MRLLRMEIKKLFKLNFKEFIYVLILPLIISIIYFFFQNYKEQLALNRNNFSFWQIYTKDFVNDNFNHYFGNLVFILIFSIAIFFILSKIKKEYLFKYFLLYAILITPLIGYLSDKYLLFSKVQSGLFLGSSGFASSFMGLFMFLILLLTYNKISIQKTFYTTLSIIIVPFLLIYYFRIPLGYILTLILILIMVLIKIKKIKIVDIKKDEHIKFLIILFLYLILIKYAYPYDYKNVNFLNHYFSLAVGIGIGNVFALTSRLK